MRLEVELLSSAEAAELLGVGTSRVRQMHLAGELPAAMTLPGRTHHLFLRVDVERLRAEREARQESAVA